MKVIEARNVNDAVAQAIPYLLSHGIREESRNGVVLVAPTPVCTIYQRPKERVLFSALRDANPFFHLMEALWMLDGRNDLAFPRTFNQRFGEYSDDGKTVWGAYGWRWKEFFGYDQIDLIVEELRRNPLSRRCVLSMWNAMPVQNRSLEHDLHWAMNGGKDVPCNTNAYFDVRGGKLNMTVCNRSNDVIWGAYGANVVHFSILQEYMAARIGVEVGVYRQVSNNFHAYTDIYNEQKLQQIAEEANGTNYYLTNPHMKIVPIAATETAAAQLQDCICEFIEESDPIGDTFLSVVAEPMLLAWRAHKLGDYKAAKNYIGIMPNCDWKLAAHAWLVRREEKQHDKA